MKLEQLISKGYYINLKHREDKKNRLHSQLVERGLENVITRFEGVYPSELGYVKGEDGKYAHIEYSIAAAKAHINVIKEASENNYENVLVLEDDSFFYDEEDYKSIDVIIKAIEEVKKIPNWEVLYLGGDLGDPEIELVSDNLAKVKNVSCCHAYVLNKTAYERVLYQGTITHFDTYVCLSFTEKYMCYPLAITQEHLNSTDIGETQITMGLSFWKSRYDKPIIKLY